MNKILNDLWDEYMAERCAMISTEDERMLIKKAARLHERVSDLLDEKQRAVLEEYIEALYDTNALLSKKAFFKGCEFGISFILF